MKSLSKIGLVLAAACTTISVAQAPPSGPVPTQVLVNVDPRSTPPASPSAITVAVNGKKQPVTAWDPVTPANAEVALLIDDGLDSTTLSRELDNLRSFVRTLPAGIEITVGYMHNNQVTAPPFTTDHELAASSLRLPQGMAGLNSNPYISVSNFVKNWPSSSSPSSSTSSPRKARFLVMLTDGVDPTYNNGQADARVADVRKQGSDSQTATAAATSQMQPQTAQAPGVQTQLQGEQQAAQTQLLTQMTNAQGQQAQHQESPFVNAAVRDAQRAGVAINEIYYSNGSRTGGLTYLLQITQATGGTNYFEGGKGNPVSTAPFLQQFQRSIAQTYIASFNAPVSKKPENDMTAVKFTAPSTKLHATEKVRVGNQE